VEQNYDVRKLNDTILYYDVKEKTYKELTKKIYESIQNGNLRF